jgi:hypothetical protein
MYAHEAKGARSVSTVLDPLSRPEGYDISAAEWHQTPHSVRLLVLPLLKRLDALEAHLPQNSSNSSRPPSTDTPSTKRQRRMKATERRKSGAKPGHGGHAQALLEPTATMTLLPEACACGHQEFSGTWSRVYHKGTDLATVGHDDDHTTCAVRESVQYSSRLTRKIPAPSLSGRAAPCHG